MPKVYFDGNAISDDYDVEMEEALGTAIAYSVRYYPFRPVFAGSAAAEDGLFQHVVLCIDASEVNAEFPRPGYYVYVDLRPRVAQRHFGIVSVRAQ